MSGRQSRPDDGRSLKRQSGRVTYGEAGGCLPRPVGRVTALAVSQTPATNQPTTIQNTMSSNTTCSALLRCGAIAAGAEL